MPFLGDVDDINRTSLADKDLPLALMAPKTRAGASVM